MTPVHTLTHCFLKIHANKSFHRKMYNCLLVKCHPCLTWPPVLPLDLTILRWFSRYRFQWTQPTEIPDILFVLPRLWKIMNPSLRPCATSCNMIIFFIVRNCQPPAQPPRWRNTSCQLSVSVYSMNLQLPSIPGTHLLCP
jgi:hypothetical protein